eukprot:CAMPEP_0171463290 /NCGR_PEP_ID=MMETSP0945-20130129/7014_1 /TAXON_ID=109269 /ORGANISM="Vaucheria litorea, Strain CCMP2940" /LENGTH=361 /DNA_ID=CAMNT_0011990041 /DNA_START=72 /DNA_END=1154 /DNA_ORIENTATION=+
MRRLVSIFALVNLICAIFVQTAEGFLATFKKPAVFRSAVNNKLSSTFTWSRFSSIGQIFGEESEDAEKLPLDEEVDPLTLEDDDEIDDDDDDDLMDEDDLDFEDSSTKKKSKVSKGSDGVDESDIESNNKVAEELLEMFPDAPVVDVDFMGNVIGGENPFEDFADQSNSNQKTPVEDVDEWPEIAGEIGGMDDPIDAPWRRRAEEIIRREITESGLNCYDIMWSYHKLEITVTRSDVPEDHEEAGYVESDDLMKAIKAVNASLEREDHELNVLSRFELIVATPGSDDILTTDREFKAYKGYDVIVVTGSTFNIYKEVVGKLHEKTFDELIITQNGRKVRIPTALVDEVRLPKAKVEPGDEW